MKKIIPVNFCREAIASEISEDGRSRVRLAANSGFACNYAWPYALSLRAWGQTRRSYGPLRIPSALIPVIFITVLTLSPVSAEMPSGPLKQMSEGEGASSAVADTTERIPDPAMELREAIESAATLEVSFEKTMEINDSEKSFITKGKIYYRKDPLLFRAELPSEVLQIDAKSRKRLVKKHNEIYIDDWFGKNPILMYFDIPGGVYESGTSLPGAGQDPSRVVFRAGRDGDEIEAIYDRKEKMLKSVKVENSVMRTFTEIKSWKKNAKIAPGVFDFPRGAKIIDMRK